MTLQRHNKSGLISFLDKTIEAKAAEAATESNEAPLKPAQKADNSSAIDNRAGSILSAGRGSVSDFGGPSKQIGSQTSNSIWDSKIIESLAAKQDNGEKIKEENLQLKSNRNAIKEERLDNMAQALQDTDMRKADSVANSGEYSGSKYSMPQNNISIFDSAEFERIPEKTAGEQLTKEVVKDDSWKDIKPATKTSDQFNKMFDNMTDNEKE
jgi:hypothetical protein